MDHRQVGNNQTISIVVSAFNKPESKHQVPASEYAEVLNDRQRTASSSDAFMAFGILLMDRLKFLIPYRQVIFHDYQAMHEREEKRYSLLRRGSRSPTPGPSALRLPR